MEHHHLDIMVQDVDGVVTFWDGKTPGIHKTAKVTSQYQILMAEALALPGCILFDRSLFTVTREKNVQAMRDTLENQMCRYQWLVRKPTNDHGDPSVKLTGKVGNQQDDLLIALFMVIYGGRLVMCNPGRLQ